MDMDNIAASQPENLNNFVSDSVVVNAKSAMASRNVN
jgi:hypothetical protein